MINLNYLKELYSVSDIQEYFEYIIKKHEPLDHNPSIRINENKIKAEIHLQLKQDIISNF